MKEGSKMSDIKLYFFPVRARAEPMRMTLAAAGRKFDDIMLTEKQWATERAKSPYDQLPYLVYQGRTYGESKAIATFIARLCGLAGKSSEDAMRVDEVYCLTSSFLELFVGAKLEKDAAKKAELEKFLITEAIPRYLGYFEKMLKEGDKGYFVASALSLADLTVYDITHSLLKQNSKVLDSFPEICKMRKNVEANKNVKAYLNSRPDSDF